MRKLYGMVLALMLALSFQFCIANTEDNSVDNSGIVCIEGIRYFHVSKTFVPLFDRMNGHAEKCIGTESEKIELE